MDDARALLLTDVVDSTELNDRLGDAVMAPLWAAHDRLARDLVRQWRGREIGRSDGFLLLFDAAGDAVGFALAYHRLLAGLDVPLRARVGVHVGAVTLRENSADDRRLGATPFELDGIALPVAARVMAAAAGGQTLLSAAAAQALGAAPLAVQGHGHWRMKGVAEPIELFEVGEPGAAFAPPPDSAKAYRVVRSGALWMPCRELAHTLPAERDDFIGRGDALAAVSARFERGARLVSLLGIGGVGKTRLAQRFGRAWLGDHPGGTWFCDLSQARSLDGLLHAVAQGLQLPLGGADPVAHLGRAIAGRGACLVILDNAEQVVGDVAAVLGRWLDQAAAARFVVTTRAVLGLPGEAVLDVAPLPPQDGATLFTRRAEAASAGFRPGPAEHAAIDALVRLLDGLPLAIELAAARVRVMSPGTMLQRMGERFRLLAGSPGARPDRQATLRGAFDWSWDLLGAAEKAALAQLSVFEGGFTLTAAEAVLDLADGGAPWVPDVVQALVEKSLLRRVRDARFEMLPSLQAYAAEHLATPGRFAGSGAAAHASALARHARHFAALDEPAAVADGCVEIDNLAAACRRAAAAGDGGTATAALLAAWSALRLVGPFRAAVDLARQVEAVAGLDSALQADIDWVAGSALHLSGEVDAARSRLLHGLQVAPRYARLHCTLGELLTAAGEVQAAQQHLDRALALAQGDTLLRCRVLNSLGALAGDQSRIGEARRRYEAALALARSLGDRRWEGGLLGNLGGLAYGAGRVDEAIALYGQALDLAQQTGDRRWEGNARCNLGLLLHEAGQSAAARPHFEAARAIAREMGYVRLEATVSCNLGLVVEADGDLAQAAALHESAVAIAQSLGDRRSEGQFRGDLGRVLARLGRDAQARRCFDDGAALLEGVDDGISLGLLLCKRLEALGCDEAADAAGLAQARELLQRSGAGADSELARRVARLEALTRGSR